jgi:4'-phosphopantetheinyl transferase
MACRVAVKLRACSRLTGKLCNVNLHTGMPRIERPTVITIATGDALCFARVIDDNVVDVTTSTDIELASRRQPVRLALLKQGEVHVWCAHVMALLKDLDYLNAVLSADEHAREQRYVHEKDAQRFAVVRGLLRCILGSYLETSADELAFTHGPFGKPMVDHSLQFNVSHSDGLAVLALAWNVPVGIDIERIAGRVDVLEIAAKFFGAEEHEYLRALPALERERAFYRIWTRKEACSKLSGAGIGGLGSSSPPCEVTTERAESAGQTSSTAATYRVVELSVHPDYCAALAVGRSAAAIRPESV